MNIAVIGWGSLIWNPGKGDRRLRVAQNQKWKSNGPSLPVEFSDISDNGRLTLSINLNVPEIRTYWIEHAENNLDNARKNLASRERTDLANIHFVSLEPVDSLSDPIKLCVRTWLQTTVGQDAALWTNIPSRFQERFGSPFSTENALEYLGGLTEANGRLAAFEYVAKAPPQTATEVRKLAMKSFGLREQLATYWAQYIE